MHREKSAERWKGGLVLQQQACFNECISSFGSLSCLHSFCSRPGQAAASLLVTRQDSVYHKINQNIEQSTPGKLGFGVLRWRILKF